MGNMTRGYVLAGGATVNLLIIEKYISAERLEEVPLTEPTEK